MIKFLEELVRDLNGNHGCIDHDIVGAQDLEGHGEGDSRADPGAQDSRLPPHTSIPEE